MTRLKHGRQGFTLVEILVSSLILAVGAVIVCHLANQCLINTTEGIRYAHGYRLLDEALNKVASGKIRELADLKTIEGDFEPRYPNYRYRIEIVRADQIDLYRVRASVLWKEGSNEYNVQAETLFYDLGGPSYAR